MAVIWDEATYAQAYQVRERQIGHANYGNLTVPAYGRRAALNIQADDNGLFGLSVAHWKHRILELGAKVQLSFGSSMLVVGCGYGYLLEAAIAEGMNASKVWGADTSSYIQANRNTEAHATITSKILNIDITNPNAANLFKPFVGGNGKFNWIVTELVVESLDEATELIPFLDACDNLRTGPGGVAHILVAERPTPEGGWKDGISPQQTMIDLGMTMKSLAGWAAIRPTHFWINAEGYQVLGGV